MKSAVFASTLAVAAATAPSWDEFKAQYGKVYNGDEETAAKATYESNMQWAAENSNADVQFGANQFADLNTEQYKVAAGLGYKANRHAGLAHLGVHEYQGEELAASVDWTTQGAVTPVKDQGQCGSCWAFSTTGGMEGAWQIASGSLTSMSEQQLVDCSTQNAGCNGGSMELAFNYAGTTNVATESSYPYTARDGSCKTSYTTAIPRGGVTGYKSVGQSTDSLKSALQTGPVSVAIEADQMAFQLYSGGVLSSGCGTNLDHGVLAVGYDSNSFKVKNSWGSSWGNNGYLQISQSGNTCGIHSDASYPTVSAGLQVRDAWDEFKAKYGLSFNGDEDATYKATYQSNMQWASENSNDEVQFGENQFAHLTQDQYRTAAGLGYKASALKGLPHLGVHEYQGEELAANVDWTTQGAVTPVKDQGQCGSCWAFSTTGGMEGAWQIASGSLTSMSEQQLVDCSTQNAGCNGGSMELAFNYAGTTNVATESSYPYTARDGTCKTSYTTAIPRGGVTGYKSVGQSTDSLKSALQTGPVSVAIEADQMAFQLYSGGVLSSGCGTNLDHGVLAVGYDSNSFKVKNSWGTSWGNNGYLQISQSGNTCGIHSDASYPTVSASVEVKEEPQYAKGFVRMPRNAAVPVGEITPEMRAAAPAALDWTETAGAITPVKDQAQCGSCWAFSATEGIESAVFQATGSESPALSPQQIVSCDKTDGGCNGGDLPTAFDYVESAGGLDTEEDYPYTSKTGRSGSCKSSTPVVKVTDYKYAVAPCEGGSCSSQDEDGMKAALAAHGPLSVCVNAETWNSYYGGVLSGSCSGKYNALDHCVQLVGYDTTASTPYWKVRNSWGTSWGEKGFIRLPMGQNSCGIADEAMYVTASMAASVV